MTTKCRQSIYGASVRAATEGAKEARKQADRLACEAWTKRMPRLGRFPRVTRLQRGGREKGDGATLITA